MPDIPEVLFVCVHNAGRSQMAAALLDRHAGGRVRVRSAGSAPADEINPAVREAMAELGLDLSHEFPKPLTDQFVRAADVVITMGCGDACPFHPGKRYLDWELDDPAGEPLEVVRRIRDEIDRRVRTLLDEMLGTAGAHRDEPPIACSLDAAAMPEQLAQWAAILGRVETRTRTNEGALRLELAEDVDPAELARLVTAEQRCCPFFSFAITVDVRGIALEVRAPGDATSVVEALFGVTDGV